MSALNALLDDNGTITTAGGELIHCDPNTIFILTTNPSYRGCRSMNEAVISRMDMVYEIDNLDAATLMKRGMAATGFKDQALARVMAETVLEIDAWLENMGYSGGVCGPREYINWLRHTKKTKDPIKSIVNTVLTKASLNAEVREDIMNAVVKLKLTEDVLPRAA